MAAQIDDPPEGGTNVSDQTYSSEQVKALVAAAVAEATEDLQKKLDNFERSQEASEVEARIAAARAESEERVAELQGKLDAAVIEAEQLKAERDEVAAERDGILEWLKDEGEKAEREAEIARLKDERVEKVASVVTFPDDYVAERAEEWASLSEDDFAALLKDYEAIAAKAKAPSSTSLPKVTSMETARSETETGSAVREVLGFRRQGIDPRNVIA